MFKHPPKGSMNKILEEIKELERLVQLLPIRKTYKIQLRIIELKRQLND